MAPAQLSFNFTNPELPIMAVYHVSNLHQVLFSTNDPVEATNFFLKTEEPTYIWINRDGVRDVVSFRLITRHALMEHIWTYYDVLEENYEDYVDSKWETSYNP